MSEYQNVKKSKLSFKGTTKMVSRKRDESRAPKTIIDLPDKNDTENSSRIFDEEIKVLNGTGSNIFI